MPLPSPSITSHINVFSSDDIYQPHIFNGLLEENMFPFQYYFPSFIFLQRSDHVEVPTQNPMSTPHPLDQFLDRVDETLFM